MRNKKKLFLITFTFVLVLCLSAYIFHCRGASVNATQSLAELQFEHEKSIVSEGYSFDDPNIILDPYKSSPLSAVIAFETDELVRPKIEVVGKDDKTSLDFEFELSKNHILPVYGLYADYENTVIVTIGGESREFKIRTEKLPETVYRADVKTADRDSLNNELYFFTPSSTGNTCAYDINGDVRWYLTNYALWNNERLRNGHILVSTERLLNTPYYMTGLYEIDLLGKIHAEYSLPGGYHHDYFELDSGNLLVLSNNFETSNDTVEDYVVELDRMTGEIVKEFDLKKILPVINTGNENWSSDDWFHNNAIWYDSKTNSILLSGRHMDAVVSINYDSSELNWILGDSTGWPEEYDHYFLRSIGDNFEWQWSQHAISMTDEGYLMLFDNGNNKSKNAETYVNAKDSYSRAVMYKIDEYEKTVEQVWQYGKERGSEFYSPYISDVDYLANRHYIVHSGGIVYKDGEIQNQPAGAIGADELYSDTVEMLDGEVVFEMMLPSNTYRVEKMSAYASSDRAGVETGMAMQVGSLGRSEVAETKHGLLFGESAEDIVSDYDIKLTRESDRLVFSGSFKRNSNVRLILSNDFEQKYYKMRITDKAHAALCVAVFTEDEAGDDILNVKRYVNFDGLSGKYHLYLELFDKIYDLGQTVDI